MSCFVVRKIDHPLEENLSAEKYEIAYRKGDIVCAYTDKQCKALGVTERVQSKKHIVVKVPDLPDIEAMEYERPFKRDYSLQLVSSGFGQCCFDMTINLSQSEKEVFTQKDVLNLTGHKKYNTYEVRAKNQIRLYFNTEDTGNVEGYLQHFKETIRVSRWALPDEIVDSADEYGVVTMTKNQFLGSVIDKRSTINAHKAVVINGPDR